MSSVRQLEMLFVEDHEEIRESISSVLESEGHAVCAVSTAEDGLELLRSRRFALLLTDYSLPGRSGAWLVQTAQDEGLLEDTPVLVVTAHPNPVGLEGLPILYKPLELDVFLREVHRLLESARRVQTG